MRVLLITDWMSEAGGAETYIIMLRDSLRNAGDDVRLIACGASFSDVIRDDERVYGSDRAAEQAFLQVVNPFAVARVRSAVREFRPEVAFVSHFAYHSSPAVLLPLRKIPLVVSVTDYKSVCPIGSKLLPSGAICSVRAGIVCQRNGCVSLPHWLRDRPRYALMRRAMAQADRVLSPSRWVQAELAANSVRSEHLPLGAPAAGATFRRNPAATPLFLYCGRLSREKGVRLLIGAFARVRGRVPGARLRIVGDGPERSDLESLVTTMKLDEAVTFAGRVAHQRVETEFTNPWALVAPSLWGEPFGLTALESIVRGMPVIASDTGGLGEIVEQNVTGLFFRNGDEGQLADCLRAVAEGRVFPSRTLPSHIVERVTEAAAPSRHVQRLRSIFGDVIRQSRA